MGEVNMLWLDSSFPLDRPETDPGIKRGECPGGIESTPAYLRENFPDGYVTFKNAAVGEIGSTYILPPTQAPVPAPTPLLHHRLVVDVIQITIKIVLLVVRHMHLAIIYFYPMVLKIIASPYGETVPERLVVDLLNALAMVTLLHVF